MADSDTTAAGPRRRSYERAGPTDMRRYESFSVSTGNVPVQLDGSLEFQVLHLEDHDDRHGVSFGDVMPVGASPTDIGAIALVEEHHARRGDRRPLWIQRGAGRDGEEIHGGYGHGLHAEIRYRILLVKTRNER